MTMNLPLANTLVAERAHGLETAATIHRQVRLVRLSRRAGRAAQPAADVTEHRQSTPLPRAA
jgi:hypothetical protein